MSPECPLSRDCAVARERDQWRRLAERCQPHIEQALAAQGDRAEPDLIQLQHEIAALTSPQSS